MNIDTAFGIHEQALKLRARRGEILAANLANGDTPGYKARDIDFDRILDKQVGAPIRLASTRAGHFQSHTGVVAPSQVQYRIPNQPSLDGNTVDVEREQIEFGANAMKYQASLRFLDGKIKGLKLAIKGS